MRSERPKTGKKGGWGIVIGLLILIILGVLAALPFILFEPPAAPPPFEVRNLAGLAEVYSRPQNTWIPLTRGQVLGPQDKVRTGAGGEIELNYQDQVRLRLKENSVLEGRGLRLFEKETILRIYLAKGTLLGTTEKSFQGPPFQIVTPVSVAVVQEGGVTFQVHSDPERNEASAGVLRGSLQYESKSTRQSVTVKGLERSEVKGKQDPSRPNRVSRKNWDEMKEAYELIQKSAATEARQMDLSKNAGALFQRVFDHGDFYTPKFGFSAREFIKDETTGETRLEIEYDVFPVGSFVGMYMKIRDVDLKNFQAIQFDVLANPDDGFPESFRIEMKSGYATVMAFAPRDFKPRWDTMKLPIRVNRSTPISEITFVFANDKVGTHKKGILHLKNLMLIPAPPPKPEEAKKPASQAEIPSTLQSQPTF